MSNLLLDNKYVLSLDSLDLSLMHQYVKKSHDNKRLLWSRPTLEGESTYCEVQIASKDIENENSYVESFENYVCNICNIDVPQLYFKQHVKSKMHQSYRKLTKKVLENVSKQIDVSIDNVKGDEQSDHFYCETCSKVVIMKHKREHNRSNYHLKSLENQKLNDKFIEMYIENLEGEPDNSEDSNNNIKNKQKIVTDTDYTSESGTEDDRNFMSVFPVRNLDYKPVKNLENHVLDDDDDSNESVELDNLPPFRSFSTGMDITNFQMYIKEMTIKYKLNFNCPTVEDNSIVIVTPKGHKDNITIDTFHSFKTINCSTYCQLCKTWADDMRHHNNTEKHVRNITQPINDNFGREVNFKAGLSHCLICNDLVISKSNHAAVSPNHRKHNKANGIKSNDVLPVVPVTKPNTMTYCNPCNRHIHTHNFSSHVASRGHKDNLKTKINNQTPVTASDNKTPSQTTIQNKQLYCEVCNVKVPQGGMAIHKKGKPHKENSITNVKTNTKPVKLNNNQGTVNKTAIESNLPSTSRAAPVYHPPPINTKEFTTAEKLSEYNKQMRYLSDTKVECWVCDCEVPNLDRNIIEHVEGFRHEKAFENLLTDHKISTKDLNRLYCELCQSYIDDFLDHINEDVDHKVEQILSDEVDEEKLIRYVHDNPLNNDPIALAYREVYEVLLARNGIVRLNSSLFHCRVCSIKTLSRISEIDHMFGERHKSCLPS